MVERWKGRKGRSRKVEIEKRGAQLSSKEVEQLRREMSSIIRRYPEVFED